jgi:hypothetical protein
MPMKTYCIIPAFDSVKQYQLILTIVLVIINIEAIYVVESQARSYIINEHNFGLFGRILIHCNILVRIINNTCFRACILKFAPFSFITVYKNFHFWPDCELISNGNTILKRQQCDVCGITLWKCQKSIPKAHLS